MPIWSHSRLESFENCPRKYFYQYVAKIKVPKTDSIETFLGSRAHDALEKLYAYRMSGKQLSVDELIALFNADWDRKFHDGVQIVRREYTADDYRRVGEDCLRKYYVSYAPFDDATTLVLEDRVAIDLDGTGQYRLQGYIDRLSQRQDGTYEIHDYKTNARMPTQADKDADRQLALYQLGIESRWNDVHRVELIWHFLRFDREIRSIRTPEALNDLRARTIALIDDIESRDGEDAFETKESALCDWCDFQHVCPLRKHLVQVQTLEENEFMNEPGVQLVDRYADLTARIKSLKGEIGEIEEERDKVEEAILARAEEEELGMLTGSTHEIRITDKVRVQLPTKSGDPDAYAELDDLLRDSPAWRDISSMDTSVLRRIWKGDGEDPGGVRDLIKPFVEETEETGVSLRRRKDTGDE